MKKNFLFAAFIVGGHVASAQHAGFESPSLPAESAWYGQDQVTDGDTLFNSGSYHFETNYNSGWGTYAGWAVSNITDNTTQGWMNQNSAITGSGEGGSSQYGICFATPWEDNRIFNTFAGPEVIAGFYVTNTTYAYYAMLNGDGFTKPFGADTNAMGVIDGTNGEDWFLLTVYGLGADSLYTGDSVNFYLADYRFANDADDYIVDEWTFVDLSGLGAVKGLDFVLSSTDTSGGFGMNNPSYFAMDHLIGAFAEAASPGIAELAAFPNPTTGNLTLPLQGETHIALYDIRGNLLLETVSSTATVTLDLSSFDAGVYLLTTSSGGEIRQQKIVKQ